MDGNNHDAMLAVRPNIVFIVHDPAIKTTGLLLMCSNSGATYHYFMDCCNFATYEVLPTPEKGYAAGTRGFKVMG